MPLGSMVGIIVRVESRNEHRHSAGFQAASETVTPGCIRKFGDHNLQFELGFN